MRIIPRLIFLAVFSCFASAIWAQNCGCADAGNCPFQFMPGANTQVCYDFTDAFNNDLASPTQGVCGVYIKFRDGHIGDLDLTLTSPAGQSVQLTGSALNCNTFTPLATWDVVFVPCAATCHPDTVGNCIYPCTFDNCPTTCPWGSGTYSGEYHPYSGCLEDFNTGVVNGQWCIDIANGAPFNGGSILDFEIILCDQSGILCCDADAGNIPDPNVTACIGDPALDLDLDPVYGAIVPDPTEYGYTFTVFHNGQLYDIDTTDNFTSYPVGTYTVCGLSYLLADESSLPTPGTVMTPQSLDADLHGATPPFCGDIGLNCVVVNIGAPPPLTILRDTICDGQTVVFDGQNIGSPGTYADTLASFFGCDSLVNLILTVMPNVDTKLFETLCFGDTVWVGGNPYTTSGTFVENLLTSFGCDSMVTLELTVLPENAVTLNEIICEGESFAIGNINYSSTGTYVDVLNSWQNCDSTITLNLTVVETSVSIVSPDTLTCAQNSVALTSTASTSFGALTYQWTTNGGSFSGATDQPNATATAPGEYILTVTAAGCSSSATVTVLQDAAMPNANIVPSAMTLTCANSLILLNGNNSTPTSNFNWVWTALGGSPISNPNTLIVTITEPDTYRLIITDVTNFCKDTATIVIDENISLPTANAGQDLQLSCTMPTVTLIGTGSTPNGGISFDWSTSGTGNILPPTNTSTVTADAPGTYQLVVEDLANGCRDTDIVLVTVDTLTPNAQIALPEGGTLNCNFDTLTLDGSGSTGSQFIVYQWIGDIFNQQGTPIAHTATPGIVTLKLTDTSNGCIDSTSVNIGSDFAIPNVDAGPDDSLSCTELSVMIGGNGTSSGPDFTYEWTASPGGSFLDPTDQPIVSVNEPASYLLTVTDTTNGCTSSDFTIIIRNEIPPVADAGPDLVLNCTDTSVVLDASNSTIVPFAVFEWTNSSGTLLSNDVQLTVDYPDTFYFHIELAFCASTDTVIVTEGTAAPSANAGADQLLDCLTGQATLDGTGSDSGFGFDLKWTALSGHVLSGEMTTTPIVDEPGEYLLQVTNLGTGCVSFDTVLVSLDTLACTPLANAGADGLINCFSATFTDTLQASGTVGPEMAYNWTAVSGNVLNQNDPFAPMVTAGEYIFTVTNIAVGLSATDTVLVMADTLTPIVVIDSNILSLTCPALASCTPIDATGTSTGPAYSYFWETGTTGNICTDPTQLNAEVQGPDVYTLTVTSLLNGCQAEAAVLVQLLDFQPTAVAGSDYQIPCDSTTTILNGNGSSVGGTTYTYQWFSFGGDIVANGQTLMPEVMPNNPSDTFTLVVSNSLNLCQDTDQVVIFAPVNCNPTCGASVTDTLDCSNNSVTLVSTGSSTGPGISYAWSSVGGSFCAPQNLATTCADAPGIYELTVTRTYASGAVFNTTCQVQVLDNSQPPAVNAGFDDDLNCMDQTLTLNGAGSATGSNISYQWSTSMGNFCGSTNQITTCVDEPGIYNLLVTNLLTGCSAMDAVAIGLDTLHPVAEAGPSQMLSCNNNTVVLMGSAAPANVSYLWTTPDGDICAGDNTPNPVICDAGTYILTVTVIANGCTDSDLTSVSIDSNLPNPDAGPNLNYTCSDTIFILNSTATGGTVLDYQWTATNGGCFIGPTDVLQPTVACPGTYSLTATDQLTGCSGVSQMQVLDATSPPNLQLGNAPHINCQTPIVSLNASGSMPAGQLDFAWSTLDGHFVSGQNTATPQVDTAGTYTVVVTNQVTHCTASGSLMVTMDSNVPVVNAGIDSTLSCTRNSLTLSGVGSTTGASIGYLWTTMDGNILGDPTILNPTIDAPGSYVLTVSDANTGCVVMDTMLVTMDTVPPVAAVVASQTPIITCSTPQVQLLSNGGTQGQLGYLWETQDGHFVFGTTGQNATVDSAGIYLLTVTLMQNGCTDTASIAVAENRVPPPLSFGLSPLLTCDSVTAELSVLPGTPNYSYQWSGPGTILGGTTPMPTVDQPGIFSVTVTDPANGCEHDSSLVVSQNTQKPVAEAVSIGKLDCENLTATVSGEGSATTGVSYFWTTTSTGNIAQPDALTTTVDASGWYFILVKRLDNGCTAIDSTEVIATAQPIENVLLTLEHPDCLDPDGYIYVDSVFGGLPPYFYSVDGDIFITYPQFSYLTEGQHTVVVKDGNGCYWTDTVTLLGPGEILVNLGPDVTLTQGENLLLQAQLSIPMSEVDTIWWTNLPDSIECPTCLEQSVSPIETTTYRIHVIDTNGCAAMDAVTIVVSKENPFYVPTAFSPNGDGTNDRFLIYAGPEVAKVRSFRIFDRWGNLVFFEKDFQPNAPQFGWDGSLDGQAMDPAVFVWKADMEFMDGTSKVFYGDVTLMR